MIRALLRWLDRWLCSYGIHHVDPEDREHADELEGGYRGPCSRCPAQAVDDRSRS